MILMDGMRHVSIHPSIHPFTSLKSPSIHLYTRHGMYKYTRSWAKIACDGPVYRGQWVHHHPAVAPFAAHTCCCCSSVMGRGTGRRNTLSK
mmetsp:Transcript_6340/g.15291  ORF Transcript_6340/g.15291 Transcript_6340/m.15291 type:complete len:91 (-) Transcript_6340:1186-1458(-)